MQNQKKLLDLQQAQFDALFKSAKTLTRSPNDKAQKADMFIEKWAEEFSPYQLDILADEFGWSHDQREKAIRLYEKACAR